MWKMIVSWRFAIFAAAAIWSVIVFACFRHVPVGVVMQDGSAGGIKCIVDGRLLPCQGPESFPIPVDATHFHFELAHREAPYGIVAISVLGIQSFSADWLARSVAPDGLVYDHEHKPGEPLFIRAREGNDRLDYVRFFDLLPRLFRLGRVVLAVAPFAILLAWCVVEWLFMNWHCIDRPYVFLAMLLIFTLMSFPDPIWPSAPGLDPSWSWLLNHVAWTKAFGRDVVFTYGPLGFLLHPECSLENAVAGLVLSAAFAVSWFWALLTVYNCIPNGRFAAWMLLFTMLFPQPNLEWRLVLLAVLLTAVPVLVPDGLIKEPRRLAMLATGGVFFVVNALVKFTSLAAVLGAQLVCLAALVWLRRRKSLPAVVVFSLAVLVVFAILCPTLFSSARGFAAWVTGSIATARGYNINMVAEKGWLELLVPFAIVGVCIAALIVKRSLRLALPVLLVAAPTVFCTLKYAIVRQSSLPLSYCIVAVLAFVVARAPVMKRFVMLVSVSLYAMNLALVAPYALSGLYGGFPLGLNPQGIVRTVMLPQFVADACATTEECIARDDIPDDWRERIGYGEVLFAPYDMGPAMREVTRFTTVPLPSLQLYSACDPVLDEMNARLLRKGGLGWIVCEKDANWSGHFINYPRFWGAVMDNYHCVDESDRYLLLSKNASASSGESDTGVVKELTCRHGEWLDVRQFAEGDISIVWPRTVLGRFCGTFLRATMCWMNVRYDDGCECRFHLVAENLAEASFRLDRIPADGHDMAKMLSGEKTRRPVAILFEADSPSHFPDRVVVKVAQTALRYTPDLRQ